MTVSPIPMRVTDPGVPKGMARARSAPNRMTGSGLASEAMKEKRPQDDLKVKIPMPSATLSYDINRRGNSVTVTQSEQTSGVVLRKLVYNYGAVQHTALQASGQKIDVAA